MGTCRVCGKNAGAFFNICEDCNTKQVLQIQEKSKINPITKKPENLQDTNQKQVIVKTYTGSQTQTSQLFQTDSELMAAQGYFPISQSWAPGSYGCGTFLVALALCFLIVGILVFIYMLVVPPDGTLSVTYELRTVSNSQDVTPIDEKTCPMCAEQVKAAARICRFCGHNFVPDSF